MFDIGFTELLVLGLLGLLVLGPERLPGVTRQLGRYIGRARRTWDQLRRELEREVDRTGVKELRTDLEQTREQWQETVRESSRELEDTRRELQQQRPSTGPADPDTRNGHERSG